MQCPKCGSDDLKVNDTRAAKDGRSIRRRRECLGCKHRFTTIEAIVREDFVVVKQSGEREDYSQQKVREGIRLAIQKRPISADTVDKMINEITETLYERFDQEVPSVAIGELVMERLRKLDPVAYVRFASVHREFRDVGEFSETINSLNQ